MKISHFYLILFTLLLLSTHAVSQSFPDKVYLKNGSILYGKILDKGTNQQVKIEIIGNNILSFQESEILKIETNNPAQGLNQIRVGSSIQFYGGSQNNAGVGFTVSYPVAKRFYIGLGAGLDSFDYQILPLFLDLKYDLLAGGFTPFIYSRAGYSLPLSGKESEGWYTPTYQGGVLFGAGGGIQKSISAHAALYLSVGYRFQQLRSFTEGYLWYGEDGLNRTDYIEGKNRINVALGLQF